MKNMPKVLSIFIFCCLLFFSITGCDSGGDGSDGSSGIINGRVQDVVEASINNNKINNDATILVKLKNFFTFSFSAIAQQGGITVNVIQDGAIIDTTVTDEDGDFTVTGAGDVTLQFITPGGTTVEIGINIPVGTITTLNVSINENNETATVNDFQNGLRCEDGEVNINDSEVIINGNGIDDCLRAEGSCVVNIDANSVIFENCERCIDAENDAEININADSIFCEGNEDAIRGRDNSIVNFIAADCTVDGSIDTEDSSIVDLEGCDVVNEEGTEDGTEEGSEEGTEEGSEEGTEEGTE